MVLCLLVSIRFQVLFHSPPGVLFTFPSRYYTLSVTWSYLALGDGPPIFRQDSSCPDVLWTPLAFARLSDTGVLPSLPYLSRYLLLTSRLTFCGPNLIHITIYDLGSSVFARHYSRNRFFFLFLWVFRCFSSPGSLTIYYGFVYVYHNITCDEFPHSDICGL